MKDSQGNEITVGTNVVIMEISVVGKSPNYKVVRSIVDDFIVAEVQDRQMKKEVDGELVKVDCKGMVSICIKGVSDSDELFYEKKNRVVYKKIPCKRCEHEVNLISFMPSDYTIRVINMCINPSDFAEMRFEDCENCGATHEDQRSI
jgi:hypothetical protein